MNDANNSQHTSERATTAASTGKGSRTRAPHTSSGAPHTPTPAATENELRANAANQRRTRNTATTRRAPVSTFGSRTDVGCVRDHNEDSLVVAPPLFVVADGMGGHAAGEVASEIAVNTIVETAPAHADANALGEAVCAANRAVLRGVHEGKGREGMGTTCTAAMLEGERLVIAQVGDSRAYLLHQGKLQQLTRDHSLMADLIEAGQLTPEEARTHPQRSVITRALGSDPRTQPDLYEINVETGDRLLLCSDGLSGMVRDREIEATMARVRDPQRCASQLVNQAIAAGGYDNVTVIIADVTGFAEVRRKKLARKTKVTVAFVLVLLAALFGGAGYAFSYWTNTAAFLTEHDGKVAIYRGVPGSVLGFTFSELEETTDINVDDLQPGLANRLREDAITTDNVAAAEELVQTYREDLANSTAAKENAVATPIESDDENARLHGSSESSGSQGASTKSDASNAGGTGNTGDAGSANAGGATPASPQGGGAA